MRVAMRLREESIVEYRSAGTYRDRQTEIN